MIIELAGLPAAGKTTMCKALSRPTEGKGAVSLLALRPSPALLNAFRSIMRLALNARPFQLNRLKRAFNAVVLLRHYLPSNRVILLDQGSVQKLWSVLADAKSHKADDLEHAITALVPFAPDHLVWLETPLDFALERLRQRTGGNSRYDGLEANEARCLLQERAELLKGIAERLAQKTGRPLIILDGTAPAAANAAILDGLISGAG